MKCLRVSYIDYLKNFIVLQKIDYNLVAKTN